MELFDENQQKIRKNRQQTQQKTTNIEKRIQ